jgi:transposase
MEDAALWDVVTKFPDECRYLLETLREVYKHDAFCRQQEMPAEERLAYHQTHSRPLMEKLEMWFDEQFAERKVEPNSGLGEAITYMKKRWDRLTLFLRQAGAPLDSNAVERILKRAILHRKNSYFYKTENGAHVGDLFMTLIHTCQLHGVNAFDYLTQLQKHPEQVAAHPPDWMPWNYRDTLARTAEL